MGAGLVLLIAGASGYLFLGGGTLGTVGDTEPADVPVAEAEETASVPEVRKGPSKERIRAALRAKRAKQRRVAQQQARGKREKAIRRVVEAQARAAEAAASPKSTRSERAAGMPRTTAAAPTAVAALPESSPGSDGMPALAVPPMTPVPEPGPASKAPVRVAAVARDVPAREVEVAAPVVPDPRINAAPPAPARTREAQTAADLEVSRKDDWRVSFPDLALQSVRWHPNPARREARLLIEQSRTVDAQEGDIVIGVSVHRIDPGAVELRMGGERRRIIVGQ